MGITTKPWASFWVLIRAVLDSAMISAVSPGACDVFQLKVTHSESSRTEQRRAAVHATPGCKNIGNLVDFQNEDNAVQANGLCFVYAPHVKA